MAKRKRLKFVTAVLVAAFAMNAGLWLAQGSFGALPRSLADYFFGPRLVRAEVVLKDRGVVHVYRLDRGRVRAVNASAGTITLLERDGTVVTIPVAPNARILVNGSPAPLTAVKRKMMALTVRDGDAPAETVRASRR